MQKCKIISVKSLGKQKTYNLTMAGDQHNYKIVDAKGNGVYSKNSHSAAYAYIAYQCAYLKVKYPLEFMCNLLDSEINNSDKGEKLATYLHAAKNMNIICNPPHVNISGVEFKIESGYHKDLKKNVECLWEPLTILKGVGTKAVDSIVANQPFSSLEDFLNKVDCRVVNSRVFKAMLEKGCLDKAWNLNKDDHDQTLVEYENIKKKMEKEKKNKQRQMDKAAKMGKSCLFDEDGDEEEEIDEDNLEV